MRRWLISFGIALVMSGIIFAAGFELFLRISVSPYDWNFQHFSVFRENTATSVAFGNSRTTYGFSGGRWMMNLAEPGESIGVISEKIRIHFRDIKPLRVMVQIDSGMFSSEGEGNNSLEIINMRMANYANSGPLLLLHPWYASRKFSFLKYVLRGGKISRQGEMGADGFRPEYTSIDDWPDEKISVQADLRALNLLPLEYDNLLTSRALKALNETVSFLSAKGAEVCLVSFPIAAALVRKQAAFPQYEEFRKFMKHYASQKSMVFSSFETKLYDNVLFRDMVHLNARGAKLLSMEILESCFPNRNIKLE
jgi:hypothetical protein